MRVKIFLNYRREDSAPFAGRLADDLGRHFGPENVFIDINRIDLGDDFVEAINEKIGACDVLVVLIGKEWLTTGDSAGRRLDNVDDLVRREILAAKERKVRIIPVLVDGAAMPGEDQLPDALKFLARRNGLELSHTGYHFQLNRLIKAMEEIGRRHPRRRFYIAAAFIASALALVSAAYGGWRWMSRAHHKTLSAAGLTSIGATVSSMRFFEAGLDIPDPPNRKYQTRFRLGSIRFIYWELNLRHPEINDLPDFAIVAIWYKSDGVQEWRDTLHTYIPARSPTSWHVQGWGIKDGFTQIPLGRHTVVLQVQGTELARESFEVTKPAGQ